ncbi:hypothetical protein L332_12625 [Agrococcus pavilionensis RW1]|uniref:Major facilitator superfamily (MFS) profile domain-containing protein n=1 Tax=Agrococcus pavilionensis RW1 TaxID=1330458 RepID=U1MXJ2_9MICO|nr:hypothetical protein [Agrococcus pavilionensis]ERG65280.1 hypothetical protein L332_12625 [Agrococcus pavilionensis RW1]
MTTRPAPTDAPPQGRRARQELQAVVAGSIAGAAAFALGLVLMGEGLRPIGGSASVARIAALTTGTAAALSFLVANLRSTTPMPRLGGHWSRAVRVVSTIAIALVCFGLGYLAALSAGEIMQAGFRGLQLDPFAGALACGLAGAAAAYLTHPLGHDVGTRTLGALVPSFLVVGVIFSMLTASQEDW